MRDIHIEPDTATSLRQLLCRAKETYTAYEGMQKEIAKRYAELAGPLSPGEIAALRKDEDRVQVLSHAHYLNDVNKSRWY
jgi:hypothetical protein